MTERIDAFLAEPAIAVFGVSRSGRKFGNIACRHLREKGYRLYPIHPVATTIDGMTCRSRLAGLPEPVGAALVVVSPHAAGDVIRDAVAAGIKKIWLQQGAESPEVLTVCRELGVEPVAGECILMYAKPTGFHKAHQVLHRLFHRRAA